MKQKNQLTRLNQVRLAATVGSLTTLLSATTLASTGLISSTALPASSQTAACVTGPYMTKYISSRPRFGLDHSYVQLTWQPQFCRQGNRWQAAGDPTLQSLSAGSVFGVGLDLQAPKVGPNSVEYRGRVRQCIPASVGYQGISFNGTGCFTAANVVIRARVVNNSVVYSLRINTTGPGKANFRTNLVWTNQVV